MNRSLKYTAMSSAAVSSFLAFSSVSLAAPMITTDILNVRETPSITGKKVGQLNKGVSIDVKSVLNGWGEIVYNGKKAYVSAQYLQQPTVTSAKEVYKVTGSSVRIRKQPNTASPIVGLVTKGYILDVISKEQNGWYKARVNGQIGFISGEYVKKEGTSVSAPSIQPPPQQSEQTDVQETESVPYIVKASMLRVRSKASINADILGYVYSKQTVQVIGQENNGWYKIRFNNKVGYVSGEYISKLEQAGSNPPSAQQPMSGAFIVQANILNVRNTPSTQGAIMGQVHKNQQITVFEELNGWYKIQFNNSTGYVSKDYVSKVEQASFNPVPSPQPINGTFTVQADILNVRNTPSAQGTIVGKVYKNQAVTVIEELNGWYKIQFNNNTGYVSSFFVSKKEPGSSSSERVLEGRKIVLDPGHGGFDSGAVGVNGIKEKDIVLNIARKLQSKLQQSGASVIITRSGDNYISLGNRVEQSNESKGHAFLSIHANSSTSSSASGVETHYYSKSTSTAKESKELAECMQQALIKELPANNRGVKDSSFQVIRQKSVPSVLVEIGFLSNKEEANRLADPQYQERIANALYNGFIQYFK